MFCNITSIQIKVTFSNIYYFITISAPHTTFQSEEQNQLQQLQQQQHVQAQQHAAHQHATAATTATASRPIYQAVQTTASNIPNDHHVQKPATTEKEKTVFRCPDCSKSFKHASG